MSKPTSPAFDLYEAGIASARGRLAQDPLVARLASGDLTPEQMLRTLIEYCSFGVHMTEPVESWIRRAGERCSALGYPELGSSLVKHARHEAGHHTMLVADTRYLVRVWNNSHVPELDADQVLLGTPPPSVEEYRELHESTIAGTTPYAQLAIEYEIERLSVSLGPRVIQQAVALLGEEVTSRLSFIQEHVALDVGHTAYNSRQMASFLGEHPTFVDAMVNAG
ncbi:MAG: hypothetical protein KC417_00005, partial [Myxococcales bacterium]|nr:hypothetical protein [Myxococcales bacterium]